MRDALWHCAIMQSGNMWRWSGDYFGNRYYDRQPMRPMNRVLTVCTYPCFCAVCRQPLHVGDCIRLAPVFERGTSACDTLSRARLLSWKPAHIHDCSKKTDDVKVSY